MSSKYVVFGGDVTNLKRRKEGSPTGQIAAGLKDRGGTSWCSRDQSNPFSHAH